jgi:CRISPR-associated endonuclease/helicase Cas3
MSSKVLTTIIVRNIDPSLRRILALFLFEVSPLIFVGRISSKAREGLWEQLNKEYPNYHLTMITSSNMNENGFQLYENFNVENVNIQKTNDNLMLSVRRQKTKNNWETILGKSEPRYPLIKHLIDTSAFIEILWQNTLSEYQKKIIVSNFVFQNQNQNNEDVVFSFIKFVAGMHDIGKANPEWQVNTLKIQPGDESLQNLVVPKEIDHSSNRWKHDINGGIFFEKTNTTNIKNVVLKEALSTIVAAHHGHFNTSEVIKRVNKKEQSYPEWVEVQKNIETQIAELVEFNLDNNDIIAIKEPAIILITGLVVLADWLASRIEFMYEQDDKHVSYKGHYEHSKKIAQTYIEKFGLQKPEWKNNLEWSTLFPHIPNPNPLQQSFINNIDKISEAGLTLISAPMGIGKTETSLFLATKIGEKLNNNGFWVTLPTQATANSIFKRCTDIATNIYSNEYNSVSLMHSNSGITEAIKDVPSTTKNFFTKDILQQPDTVDDNDSQLTNSNEPNIFISDYLVEKKIGGLSSIAVSTVDQLISAALPLKHNMLRWLALSGKTLIFDEIHDFDEYTFGIIIKTIEWCGKFGIPVIAMSATLSGQSQQRLVKAYLSNAGYSKQELDVTIKDTIPNEGLASPEWVSYNTTQHILHKETLPSQSYVPYNLELHATENFAETVENIVLQHLEKDANILVVCHTVNQAIALRRYLFSVIKDGTPIELIHSRMPETQKQKAISEMLRNTGKISSISPSRKKRITIATQIVQQSMDIDYDVLVTLLAPLPEIFQRIGRIYRHEQGDKRASFYQNNPYVHIVFEKSLENYNENSDKLVPKSFIPYNEFDLFTSLFVLKAISNKQLKWNVKEDITASFKEHYKIASELSKNIVYKNFYEKKTHKNNIKNQEQNRVTVCSPPEIDYDDIIDNFNLTAPYTNKSSLAAGTRLIEENKDIVFAIEKNNKIYIIEQTDGENILKETYLSDKVSYSQNLKILGSNTLTISQAFYKKFNLDNFVLHHPNLESFTRYLTFVDYNKIFLQADIKYDTQIEGLSPQVIEPNDYLWI